MQLRIEVDQAEAFRRGIDCPKSIMSIEVDPAELDSSVRELIAKRMSGIDVCELDEDGTPKQAIGTTTRLKAKVPTLAGLIEAVERDEARVKPDFKPAALEQIEEGLASRIGHRVTAHTRFSQKKAEAENARDAATQKRNQVLGSQLAEVARRELGET